MPDPSGPFTRAAPLRASSWSPDEMTFTVVLSAGTSVERFDARGAFNEILDIAGAQYPDRIPLLDSHNRSSLNDKIGEVTDIHREGAELVGAARLSKHSPMAMRVAAELTDGAKFGVSIGYAVTDWAETKPKGKRTKTATKFDVLEASLVAIPADPAATIRSIQDVTTNIVTRAQTNAEIRSIAKTAGLDDAWANGQIDNESELDAVRAAALTAMQERAATVRSTNGHNDQTLDNPAVRVRAAGEALYARSNPTAQISEQARAYVGMGTVDLARESLRHAAISTVGMSAGTIVERALHTTSDFPLVLGDTMGRTMREAYAAAPSGLKMVGRQTTARDFRSKYRLQLSEAPRLEKVNEDGEFTSGTMSEARESYKLATYGRIIGISRQAIINDDLSAFADLSRRFGLAAAATEAQLLVDLILLNSGNGPTMSDTKALFHADHGNKAVSGAAIAEATLGAARMAIRKQVGLSGELITITPKYLIVPADLETKAEKELAAISPAKAEDVNVFSGKLSIVVEPRFTSATRWYVSADTATVDGLEYAYLEGEQGVQIETKAGFEVDGVQVKARVDFGAGFVDHRGWYANAGT